MGDGKGRVCEYLNIILRVLSNAQGYPRTRETRVDRQKVNKHSHILIEKTSLKLK